MTLTFVPFSFSCVVRVISKGLGIHKQVKINNKNEQRFGVVMTPLSSSELLK